MGQKADLTFLLIFDDKSQAKDYLLSLFLDRIEKVYTFSSIEKAAKEVVIKNVDIIFIDVRLAELSLIQKIKNAPYPALVYYVADKKEMELSFLLFQNAFAIDAPLNPEKIKSVVSVALQNKSQLKALSAKILELRSEKEEDKYFFDSSPNLILVAKNNEIIRANGAFLEFFGYPDLHSFKNSVKEFFSLVVPLKGYLERDKNWMEAIVTKPLGYKKVIFKNREGSLIKFHIEHKNVKDGAIQFSFSDITANEEILTSLISEYKQSTNQASNNFKIVWESMKREISRANRYKDSFSILTFCVSDEKYHLEKIDARNDKIFTYVEKIVTDLIRPTDIFGKWENNRYIILAAHTPVEGARKLCKRLINKIEVVPIYKQLDYHVHFGIAYFKEKEDRNFLFKKAQNLLNKAHTTKESMVCEE